MIVPGSFTDTWKYTLRTADLEVHISKFGELLSTDHAPHTYPAKHIPRTIHLVLLLRTLRKVVCLQSYGLMQVEVDRLDHSQCGMDGTTKTIRLRGDNPFFLSESSLQDDDTIAYLHKHIENINSTKQKLRYPNSASSYLCGEWLSLLLKSNDQRPNPQQSRLKHQYISHGEEWRFTV